jgi:hypothetical protein
MRGLRVRRDAAGDFFICAGSGASGTDGRAVDTPQFPVDVPILVELDLQRLDDGGKDAAFAPLAEMVIHRLPGAKAIRQITPGCAGAENPENTIEQRSSITRRTSCPCGTAWHVRFDQRPLLVRELVAFHK